MIIPLSIVRFFQLVFTVVVLALSIVAIKWQVFGQSPAASNYAAFTGGFGLLITLIGIVAIFLSAISGIIMAALDGVAFLFLLAAGIAYAVKLRGMNCGAYNDFSYGSGNPVYYDITNAGSYQVDSASNSWEVTTTDLSLYGSHCTTAKANTVFMFLACVACVAAAVLALLAHRRGGVRRSTAV